MLVIDRNIVAQSATATRPASLGERALAFFAQAHARRPRQEFWQALRQQLALA
jgi:hypothetical protein